MREIKFRAWDGKEMHQDVVIVNGKAFRNEKSAGLPMQYTGLNDKNGKEIYEGDILSDSFGTKNPYVGPVEWSEDWAMFCVKHDKLESLIRWAKVSEIIGNIYENPELIEVIA